MAIVALVPFLVVLEAHIPSSGWLHTGQWVGAALIVVHVLFQVKAHQSPPLLRLCGDFVPFLALALLYDEALIWCFLILLFQIQLLLQLRNTSPFDRVGLLRQLGLLSPPALSKPLRRVQIVLDGLMLLCTAALVFERLQTPSSPFVQALPALLLTLRTLALEPLATLWRRQT